MTNKQLIAERFSKAITTYSREANVQRLIAEKMNRLLEGMLSTPCHRVIEFGCGTGIYSRLLLKTFRPQELLLNDLCPAMAQCCEDLLQEEGVSFLPGDAETLSFPDETHLITSCSALQWFDAPERFFQKCHALLCPQGYLAFSTFGKENMKEIRALTGNGLPYRSREELEESLSPFFELQYSEEEIVPLSFESPAKVLYHLKQTGVTGVSGATTSTSQTREDSASSIFRLRTPRDLQQFCEHYLREFAQDNTVSLTYHPIYIIAKKKEI